jgi:hypothetical protein
MLVILLDFRAFGFQLIEFTYLVTPDPGCSTAALQEGTGIAGVSPSARRGYLFLDRRKFRHQPQRNSQPLELVVWPQKEFGGIVARIAFDFCHFDMGIC